WFQLEHDSFGIEFGTFTDRFEKLEEALNIILPMLRGERPSLAGKWYSVTEAINEPPPVRRVPVMIGGSGERKTFRMVAQYADSANIICPVDQITHKLDVIAEHCDNQGRDRSELVVSRLAYLCVAPTHDEARAELDAMLLTRGVPEAKLEAARANFHWGDPDEVAEEMATQMALGLDGFCVNSLANCWIPGRIELLGETLRRVVDA
ncbi:MAG: LLM class flavin-dependent oxidoreductase, partial [Ilumatobacteraceae bacterium]